MGRAIKLKNKTTLDGAYKIMLAQNLCYNLPKALFNFIDSFRFSIPSIGCSLHVLGVYYIVVRWPQFHSLLCHFTLATTMAICGLWSWDQGYCKEDWIKVRCAHIKFLANIVNYSVSYPLTSQNFLGILHQTEWGTFGINHLSIWRPSKIQISCFPWMTRYSELLSFNCFPNLLALWMSWWRKKEAIILLGSKSSA